MPVISLNYWSELTMEVHFGCLDQTKPRGYQMFFIAYVIYLYFAFVFLISCL